MKNWNISDEYTKRLQKFRILDKSKIVRILNCWWETFSNSWNITVYCGKFQKNCNFENFWTITNGAWTSSWNHGKKSMPQYLENQTLSTDSKAFFFQITFWFYTYRIMKDTWIISWILMVPIFFINLVESSWKNDEKMW